MRVRPQKRGVVFGALVALFFAVAPASASAESVERVDELLSAWQLEEADRALEELSEGRATEAEVDYLEGRRAFFKGDYDEAVEHLESAVESGGESGPWAGLLELVEATREVSKDYVKHTSSEGNFELYVPEGKDEVLVPFAAEALERAYDEIGDELGHKPPTPIRVEVYPKTATLAEVSSLTEEDIRNSGTIALCKYNRLMITSPKALLRGYSWVDTLIHEYVHYVINSKTRAHVPIWMHEGMAKYLERRWRGPDAQRLPPSTEGLLHKRLEDDDLITFEEMHPSMAKLPSQEDAAVAFAQVYTVMEYLRGEVGDGAFERLLEAIDRNGDAQEAFAETVGTSFERFESDWRSYLGSREMAESPEEPGFDDQLVFKEEDAAEDDRDELDKPEARDHMNLGEMLQARNRPAAALVEYQKAAHLTDKTHPVLQTRLAQCFLEDDRPEEALEALEAVEETYPSYVQAWIEMGKAHLALGDYEAARDDLIEAARINPFDPEIHESLSKAYRELGDEDLAERHRDYAQKVS